MYIVQIALCFHRKFWFYQKETLLDIRLPIFFQGPESRKYPERTRKSTYRTGCAGKNAERTRKWTARTAKDAEWKQKSGTFRIGGCDGERPQKCSKISGGIYFARYIFTWFSDFTLHKSFNCAISTNSMLNFFLCKILD